MLDTQQKNTSNLENISSSLSSLRKEKNITVDFISRQTRIKPEYLLKLEQNDFKFLPAPYVYAMLKVYGKYLEVDQKIISNCREELEILTDDALHDLVQSNQAENGHFSFDLTHISFKHWKIYGGVAFGLIFLVALILFVFRGSSDGPSIVVKSSPGSASTNVVIQSPALPDKPNPSLAKSKSPEPPKSEKKVTQSQINESKIIAASVASPSIPANSELSPSKRLTIKALSDTSWIKVISGDGTISAEALLLPNQQRRYDAKGGYDLTIGRSQAVRITLDGKPISKPRPNGWIKFSVGK